MTTTAAGGSHPIGSSQTSQGQPLPPSVPAPKRSLPPVDQGPPREQTSSSSWTVDDALAALSAYREAFPVQTAAGPWDQYEEDDDDDLLHYNDVDQGRHQMEIKRTQSLLEQLNWEGKYTHHLQKNQKRTGSDTDDDTNEDNHHLLLQFGSSLGQQEYQFAEFDETHQCAATMMPPPSQALLSGDDSDLEDDEFQEFQQAAPNSPTMPATPAALHEIYSKEDASSSQQPPEPFHSDPYSTLQVVPSMEMDRTPIVTLLQEDDEHRKCDNVPIHLHTMDRSPLEEENGRSSLELDEGQIHRVMDETTHDPGPVQPQAMDRSPLEDDVPSDIGDPRPVQPPIVNRTPTQYTHHGAHTSRDQYPLDTTFADHQLTQPQVMERTPLEDKHQDTDCHADQTPAMTGVHPSIVEHAVAHQRLSEETDGNSFAIRLLLVNKNMNSI